MVNISHCWQMVRNRRHRSPVKSTFLFLKQGTRVTCDPLIACLTVNIFIYWVHFFKSQPQKRNLNVNLDVSAEHKLVWSLSCPSTAKMLKASSHVVLRHFQRRHESLSPVVFSLPWNRCKDYTYRSKLHISTTSAHPGSCVWTHNSVDNLLSYCSIIYIYIYIYI